MGRDVTSVVKSMLRLSLLGAVYVSHCVGGTAGGRGASLRSRVAGGAPHSHQLCRCLTGSIAWVRWLSPFCTA